MVSTLGSQSSAFENTSRPTDRSVRLDCWPLSDAVTKHIGWHTFRRSLATLLMKKGEGVKVVQELMRHANSKITLDVYAQGDEQAKRAAQDHVNGLFVIHSKAS